MIFETAIFAGKAGTFEKALRADKPSRSRARSRAPGGSGDRGSGALN